MPTCPRCSHTWQRPEEPTGDFDLRAATAGLTSREADVLRRIGQGMSNQQIAADLCLSINSVKSYVRMAYRRLEIRSRAGAVLWAHGLEDHSEVHEGPAPA